MGLAALLCAGTVLSPLSAGTAAAGTVPACVAQADAPNGGPNSGPDGGTAPGPTTVATLQQAYECLFAHAYAGPVLDSRVVLVSAFHSLTEELQRRGADRPNAVLPALTGRPARDWAAFARTYRALLDSVPQDGALRDALARATVKGMLDSLHDNHTGWVKGAPGAGAARYTLGIVEAPDGRPTPDIRDVDGPLHLRSVDPGSPAATAGLKPGDVLVDVNGVPVTLNGHLTPGVLEWLHPGSADPVRLTVTRPATGASRSVDLTPVPERPRPAPAPAVDLVAPDVARITLPDFSPGAVDEALRQLAALRARSPLRGVVVDVRGNSGGRSEEVAKLLGAFVHGRTTSSDCDIRGHCTPNRTDDSVPLLGLPPVVLTDGYCASACDDFTGAVKDLGLGRLIGARTAGVVAGKAAAYTLDDGSTLIFPRTHHVSANGETVDGVGVPVDVEAPLTAHDLSTGTDPALAEALRTLHA
ncbi:S41 family peptidase [Kitasatospora phosalacinea]|uniref:S41 family peptidase n=1 Tax=Kitasatospora phosalacinea TaxID=2065 RepID=UPI0035DC42FB